MHFVVKILDEHLPPLLRDPWPVDFNRLFSTSLCWSTTMSLFEVAAGLTILIRFGTASAWKLNKVRVCFDYVEKKAKEKRFKIHLKVFQKLFWVVVKHYILKKWHISKTGIKQIWIFPMLGCFVPFSHLAKGWHYLDMSFPLWLDILWSIYVV